MSSSVIIGDNNVKPVIFREYIGVKSNPDSLDDFPDHIINRNINEFHFVLGFAHESYDVDGKGTGTFNANWKFRSFGPEKVKQLKHKHPNVKVVISIGGRDDVDGTKYQFFPIGKVDWCDNAVESLKKIIHLYNNDFDSSSSDATRCYNLIDGIDINYEHIHPDLRDDDFSSRIGNVIKRLKHDIKLDVVSIAPSEVTQKHYMILYLEHVNDIDWVNYQFYIQTLHSKDEFTNLFYKLSDEYASSKLLVGASTDPRDAGKLSRDDFYNGCIDLINSQSLRGIFIWSANDSASNPNDKPFSLEKKAQEILTD